MDFLKNDVLISEIILAVHLVNGKGTPVHKNRPSHGIAFYHNSKSTFTFEDGETLECCDGDCIFLPQGSSYTVIGEPCDSDKEVSVYAINFRLPEFKSFKPTVIKPKYPGEIRSLFVKSANSWRKKEVGFNEECMSYLYSLISHLKKDRFIYSNKRTALDILTPALDYIKENYTTDNITSAKLAQLCGISETYMRKLFANVFSVSPSSYVRNMRLSYAHELIVSGEYQVTDAAMLAGFNDASYFSREYKKAFGISPVAAKRRRSE